MVVVFNSRFFVKYLALRESVIEARSSPFDHIRANMHWYDDSSCDLPYVSRVVS